jgi:hypothetical protein
MKWIVNIEGENEKIERIRISFNPMEEKIHLYGEYKIKNVWIVFSEIIHDMIITLDELQILMSDVIATMRKRFIEHKNLDEGFSVLKWIAIEGEKSVGDNIDDDVV